MKKIIYSAVIFAVMLSSAVYAADITVTRDIDNSKFEFEGTAEPGECITVNVYAPGKYPEDLFDPSSAGDLNDIMKYHNEFYANEEGEFEFNIGINGESGVYKAFVSTKENTKEFDLEYVNKTNNDLLLDQLNKATDIEAFIETDTNRADMGFFLELYENVDKEKVAALMSERLPAATSEEAIAIFDEAVIITALSEGDITGISAYADRLAVLKDGGRFEKRYPLQASGVDKRISGRKYKTVEEFEEALAEAVVLETIKNHNGYQNVYDVMDEFKDEVGIDSLTRKTAVYQKMAGKSYSDFAEMRKAYTAYLKDESTSSSGTGGSGGGGGGNSGTRGESFGLGLLSNNGDVSDSLDNYFDEMHGGAPTPLEKTYFDDMQGVEWAKAAVNYLAENGIVSGKAERTFCPSEDVLREEFVTMIVNAFGLTKIADVNEFKDVDESDWYYECVLTASQNGIINGVGDELFGAGEKITRQDMATILYRVAEVKNIELKPIKEEVTFNDETEISDYAKEPIATLASCGIINGMGNGFFMPGNFATRAEAAQMLYGLLTAK